MFFRKRRGDGANNQGLRPILFATLVAGTLDIAIALAQYAITTGKNPELVLKFIASAVFGTLAYSSDSSMALTGLLFHYLITFVWATVFYLCYPALLRLFRSAGMIAVVFGLFIWLVMNLAVLPLTRLPKLPLTFMPLLTGVVILVVAVGLPFALIMRRSFQRADPT